MKAKQRVLALLLSVMMIITYMPAIAFAEEADEAEGADVPEVTDVVQAEEEAAEEPADAEEPSESAEPEVQSEEPEEQVEETEPAGTLQEDGETAEPVEKTQAFEKKRVSAESALPDKNLADNDDLLMDFLYRELSEKTGQSGNMLKARGSSAGNRLSGIDSILYESLKDQITAFVDPEESVTSETSVFDVSAAEILDKELVQTTINDGSDDIDVYEMSNEDFEAIQAFDGEAVVDALLADMPYELYWFDKTSKYFYGLEPTDYFVGDDCVYFEEEPGIRFTFKVAAGYSVTGEAGTTEFDTSKIQAVKVAVKRAANIIASTAAEGGSDYDKLVSYRESICDITSYNDAAAQGGINYGDPWQMIYVFDGNAETEVVCEGYSKAFQYLCDNTDFSGNIECVSVTGTMEGGEGAGPHMWNVVTIDDVNYLADVTNCDEGTVGADDQLFLAGWSDELYDTDDNVVGYRYTCNDGEDNVDYEFDEGQFMTMSESAYDDEGGDDPSTEIESFSFEPAEPITYIENTRGYMNGEYVWDEDQQMEVWKEYWRYSTDLYSFVYIDGNILYVNDVAYTYGFNEDEGYWEFFNSDGEPLDLDTEYLTINDDQSYENQWSPENPGTITLTYKGKSVEVPVTITENPVQSISFEPVEPVTFFENTNGYETTGSVWIDETQGYEEIKYYRYFDDPYYYMYKEGNKFYVNDVAYTYELNEDNWTWDFYNSNGEKLDRDYLSIYSDQSAENPWSVGGTYTATINYMGQTCEVPVTIQENPVKTLSFKSNYKIIENKNGYWDEDEDGEKFFLYYQPNFCDGDVITVNDTEYIYDSENYNGGGFYNGTERLEGVNGPYFIEDLDQWSTHLVIPEDEDELLVPIQISYMGRTAQSEVRLVRSPIRSISFNPVNEYADLREGIDGDIGEESGVFRYALPGFEEGDQLTVSYRDKDDVTYTYTGSCFVNPDDNEDRIYDDWDDGVYIFADQSDPWTLTEGDDYYPTVIRYEGLEAPGRKIRIVPNPVESISFSRNGDNAINLIEGKDSYETWDWDEETQEEIPYMYYRIRFQPGDILTVTYTDGRTCNYKYEELDGYEFVNVEDDEDILDEEWLELSANPEQSYTNPWEVNGTYAAEVSYMNRTAEVKVHILPNPVTDVEIEFADGSGTVKRVEGVDGEMDWEWIDDENGDEIRVDYFRYSFPEFKAGDKLIVTREGVPYTYVYRTRVFDGEYYRGAFVNIKSDDDVIFEDDDVEGMDTNQSGESPWELGGSGYYYEYEYYGVSFRIPAEVVENPVSGIDFERAGYTADSPIEITEGLDAEINSDGGENRWFEYFLRFKNGDKFKIVDKDGETSVYNAETFNADDPDVRYFKNESGETIDPYNIDQTSDQSSENQWKPGDERTITLGYYTRTKDVNVKIVKNPVQKIDFARPDSDVVELTREGDGFWGDRTFCYEIRFRDGDELYVTYDGESEPVKYVASASSNGKVYEFNAEGTVPSGTKETISVDDISFRHNREWQLDVDEDEQATIMLMYQGLWTDVPVKIVDSTVESFEFVWAKGGDSVELTEGVDGGNAIYYDDEGDITVFEYWLPFKDGDILNVKYTGAEEPTEYVYDEETGSFNASGNVPDGAPASIAMDDIDQRSDQSYDIHWEVGGDYEVTLDYMGSSFPVPVTIVANSGKIDINKCDVSFNEDYLVNEEIASTEYTDMFYVVPAGAEFEPIVKDGNKILGPESYTVRYIEQEFDVTADDGDGAWGPMEGAEWLDEFPTETGVYFIEVYGAGEYTGHCDRMFPLVRIGDHSWSDWTVTKEATCTTKGEKERTCSHCKVRYTEEIAVDSDAHDWSEPSYAWADDNSTCSASRLCGNNPAHIEMETANAEYKVTKEATETEAGEGQWTATFKNKAFETQTKTKTIPALSHTHSMTHTDAVAATCTEPGNSEYWYCSGCDKYFSDEAGTAEIEENSWVIDAHHVGGAAVIENEVAATCKAEGSYDEVVYCTVCGEVISSTHKTTAKIAHTEEVIPAVAATCTETGLTAGKKCSVCGDILEAQTVIPAKGHTWGKATYTWADDFTSVTGTHSCTVCGDSYSEVAQTASSEVTKAPTTTEKGEITYTSEAFAEDGFEVQTIKVDIEPLTVDEAISQAADQTEDADGKASAVENTTNEGAISDAENSATQAAALAAMAEEAAQTAYDSAKSVYDNLPADASEADKQTALANYENAVTNLAVAKQLKAAASSAVARSKKAAAKVAANKAAAAYNSANSAASSAAAEVFRKEAEAQAAIAAGKAEAADTASADAAKAVSDLGKLAEEIADIPVANTVEEAVEAAKTEADTSAGTASEASTAADTSSGNAKTSADKAKAVVNNKAKAEADAAKKAEEAAKPAKPATKPEVVDLKAVKSLKVKGAKGKLTVKWKKAAKKELKTFQYYEIQYTLDGTFKDYQPKQVGKKKASVTLKKLLKKKKYTVRIRRIRDDGSVLHVSPWKQKRAKTK